MITFLLNILPSVIVALCAYTYIYFPYRQFLANRRMHLAVLKCGDSLDVRLMTFGFLEYAKSDEIGVRLPDGATVETGTQGRITVRIPLKE